MIRTLRHTAVRASLAPRVAPLLASVTRAFHESPNKHNTTLGNVNYPSPVALKHDAASLEKTSTEYLKNFTNGELLSYFVIGLATLNKPILNLCIKMFPYVPMPIIRALVYKIYCGGETVEELPVTAKRLTERGINNMMLSLTIEACNGNDNVDPDFIVAETKRSIKDMLIPHTLNTIKESGKDINSIPPGYVALKPTGFVKDAAAVLKNYQTEEYAAKFDALVAKAEEVCGTIYEANKNLALEHPERTAPFVVAVIDAEKHELQEGVYELQRRLYAKFNKPNMPVSIVGTLQMYLSQSSELLALEEKLARENNYRLGIKLVRGAYIHSEKNRQEIIHSTKENTDENYNQGMTYCIDSILSDSGNGNLIGHLVVASHNDVSLTLATHALANEAYQGNKNRNNIVLGQLLGMADNITHNLIKNYKVDNIIKYVAWGPPLETKEYLLRRLEENGDAVKNDNGWPLVKAVTQVLSKRLIGA
ncbi:putative proline oxidase mitochondrial precursor [Suhomyces tanzawaensis NRRL Y-17324]|uniref:Proline dehydrogenase n=1 Tax=Suhomyces tanzawaensis NRRL Y-17324 TaxID=984487 RepID=A0A1E4SGM9_9ASCO|nr:putative proline oxidase mitochondrial precursor [Suhomyces tanzawaensis NRRL Y-17324]ODV78664.1 putative proline oxidase mitochondrial precursor [Suhomyces tanzawaensis NRRL Y-17324]